MFDKASQAQGVIPASSIILIILALGGALLYEKPFESARPLADNTGSLEHQERYIKQWQDPFFHKQELVEKKVNDGADEHVNDPNCQQESAAEVAPDQSGTGASKAAEADSACNKIDVYAEKRNKSLNEIRAEISKPVTSSGLPRRTLIIVNLINASNDGASIEFRRRQRVALSHALTIKNYRPQTPGQVNYLYAPLPSSLHWPNLFKSKTYQKAEADLEVHSELIPYESYSLYDPNNNAPESYKKIIVTWLSDQNLEQPALYTQYLISHIIGQTANKGMLDVSVLGPSTSAVLKKMVETPSDYIDTLDTNLNRVLQSVPSENIAWVEKPDLSKPATTQQTNTQHKLNLSTFPIVSHATTVGLELLYGSSSSSYNLIEIQETDSEVSRELVKELQARGIKVCSDNSKVLLVLEADYVYGLEYETAFLKAIDCVCGSSHQATKANIAVAYYFSMIEGKGQAGHRKVQSKIENRDVISRALSGDVTVLDVPNNRKIEKPTGAHQLDYIRRLAKDLAENSSDIEAIGVVGVDVYDKQLIFQAIRSYLKRPLLFTTDLSAIFGLPEFYPYNQNLLIASAHGLNAKKEANTNHHPIKFRDSYQTAFYRAVNLALDPTLKDKINKNNIEDFRQDVKVAPQLFEVGRNGIVNLSKAREPKMLSIEFTVRLAFILAPLGIFILFLMSKRATAPENSTLIGHKHERKRLDILVRVNAAILFALILYFYLLHFGLENPEPLLSTEGISSLPSFLFRFSAFLIGASLLVYATQKSLSNAERLQLYFGIRQNARPDEEGQLSSTIKNINAITSVKTISARSLILAICSLRLWNESLNRLPSRSAQLPRERKSGGRSTEVVFQEYQILDQFKTRLCRVMPWFLLLFVAVNAVVINYFGEAYLMSAIGFTNVNTTANYLMDFCMFGSLFIVLYCCDALRLCTSFVKYNVYDHLKWSKPPNRSIYQWLTPYAQHRTSSLELITRRTEIMGHFMVLPFLVIFLTMIARSNLFDGWHWHGGILSFYCGLLGYSFYCGSRLQQAANNARKKIYDDLQKEKTRIKTGDIPFESKEDKDKAQESIDDSLEYIANLKRGLYAPLIRHPLFQAVAWPSSAVSFITLTQMLW